MISSEYLAITAIFIGGMVMGIKIQSGLQLLRQYKERRENKEN